MPLPERIVPETPPAPVPSDVTKVTDREQKGNGGAQHTPGPWQSHQFNGAKVSVFPPEEPHRVEDAWTVFTRHEGQFVPVASYIRAADAPLIEAAPDLLAALTPFVREGVVTNFLGGRAVIEVRQEWLSAALDAVRKAEGWEA